MMIKTLQFSIKLQGRIKMILAEKILGIFNAFSREFTGTCQHTHKFDCMPIHLFKIKKHVEENKTITLILPAFPAKSPNHEKAMPPYPDLGEKLSLLFLNNLCNAVSEIYSPGARS